jgi:hypothetical protein
MDIPDVWRILIGIVLFYIILFIFAIVKSYRDTKKFIKLSRYARNIQKSFLKHLKAIAGEMVPDPIRQSSDSKYAILSYDELHASLEHAHAIMNATRWTLAEYSHRALDCEDFAMKMKVEMIHYLADNTMTVSEGMPVGIFGYTRDSDGKGHMLVYGMVGKYRFYFEPYPDSAYLVPKELSPEEIASCDTDIL